MSAKTDLIDHLELTAPPGSFSKYDIAVMLEELEKLKPTDVYLEVGVQYGRSLYIAAKHSHAQVSGVDIEPTLIRERMQGLQYNYSSAGSEKEAHDWDPDVKISLLFIDGNHSYHAVCRDIELWAPLVKRNGVILFHDCDESSPGVVRAVKEFYLDAEICKGKYGNTSIARVRT